MPSDDTNNSTLTALRNCMSFKNCWVKTNINSMARISQEKRQRALDLRKQDVTFRDIADTLSIYKSSVGAIVQKYKSGFPTLDKAKSGRPKKLSFNQLAKTIFCTNV